MFLSPLSELFGRRIILNIATAVFVLFQIGCALSPNIASLIVFRAITGMGGSACLTIGGGVISDLFEPEQRGLAMSVFSFGPLFGPTIGPICGGFITEGAGWRWVSICSPNFKTEANIRRSSGRSPSPVVYSPLS